MEILNSLLAICMCKNSLVKNEIGENREEEWIVDGRTESGMQNAHLSIHEWTLDVMWSSKGKDAYFEG